MSAIFISQSTEDQVDTDAMASGLEQQGFTSYFIDCDKQFGIAEVLQDELTSNCIENVGERIA
jgi:hypothetical protein